VVPVVVGRTGAGLAHRYTDGDGRYHDHDRNEDPPIPEPVPPSACVWCTRRTGPWRGRRCLRTLFGWIPLAIRRDPPTRSLGGVAHSGERYPRGSRPPGSRGFHGPAKPSCRPSEQGERVGSVCVGSPNDRQPTDG
jgi:hypothetical protein